MRKVPSLLFRAIIASLAIIFVLVKVGKWQHRLLTSKLWTENLTSAYPKTYFGEHEGDVVK